MNRCIHNTVFPFFHVSLKKNIAKQITLDNALFIHPIYLLLIILNTLLSKHDRSESTVRPATSKNNRILTRRERQKTQELVNNFAIWRTISSSSTQFFFAQTSNWFSVAIAIRIFHTMCGACIESIINVKTNTPTHLWLLRATYVFLSLFLV